MVLKRRKKKGEKESESEFIARRSNFARQLLQQYSYVIRVTVNTLDWILLVQSFACVFFFVLLLCLCHFKEPLTSHLWISTIAEIFVRWRQRSEVQNYELQAGTA